MGTIRGRAQRERRENTCVHFTGISDERCNAGISYRELGDDSRPGMALRLPCYPKHDDERATERAECVRFEAMGRDRVAAEDAENEAAMERTIKARAAIVEKEGEATSVLGAIDCPNCKGNLRYAIAFNGHIHAHCTTTGCCHWME